MVEHSTTSGLLYVKVKGELKQVLGTYGSKKRAIDYIKNEKAHGMSKTIFGIEPVKVGKSVDPAFSDEKGYQYIVYLE